MENNKPEWLLKAEEELAKFNESKFGKMTDGEIAVYNALQKHREENPELHKQYREKALDNGWRNPEVQSPLGVKGGTKTSSDRKESGYFESKEWKQSQSKGGKTSGNNNVKSGHWANVGGKHGNSASHAHITCPKCGHTGSIRNIKPIHFDNCIYPKMLEIISNYIKPDEELSIIKLSGAISTDLNLSRGRVETMLKRKFVEPGIKPSRYQKWKLKQF